MKFRLLKYFLIRAVSGLKSSPLLNILTVLTIIMAMLILAAFLLVFHNVNTFLSKEEGNVEISVYLKDGIAPERIKELGRIIESKEEVSNVRYLNKEEALKIFLGWNKKLGPVVEKIAGNPFPASFEVKLPTALTNPQKIRQIASSISSLSGVENVDYSSEWIEKLLTFINVLRGFGIFVAAFLTMATIFLVSNTIRLNVYSRRDEIGIMRVVGATDLFIKIPFLIEGCLQSLIGSLCAIGLLFFLFKVTCLSFENFLSYLIRGAGLSFLPMNYMLFILLLGIFVGLFGSDFAVRRFLRSEL